MIRLSRERVLEEKQTQDAGSITALSLDHKALSDVSCLADFNNLERLDLAFNNLTSLEGLKGCVNLKWLSVVQNKLQSLKGIEGLSKLTVLNAGKNKLRSMEEAGSLVSLRALILNENEIAFICGLERMKDLNTLVLSRNPICKIGDSLTKVKSLAKLSISNCQIQSIDASLKFCTALKELRLAHNDIKSLPSELALNTKLLNLDLGNNLITRWSEVKVLDSLVYLRNLNLLGNPIAEKDKLTKKVRRLLPKLRIFNARPIDRSIKNEKSEVLLSAADEIEEEKWKGETFSKNQLFSQKVGAHFNSAADVEANEKMDRKRKTRKDKQTKGVPVAEGDYGKEVKKKKSEEQEKTSHLSTETGSEHKSKKPNNEVIKKEVPVHKKGDDKKPPRKRSELDVIDDREASLAELFTADTVEALEDNDRKKKSDKVAQDMKAVGGLVTYPVKKKKKKSKQHLHATIQLAPAIEVGLGGASAWDDE